MKIKQIVIDPACPNAVDIRADEKVSVWVPSNWIQVSVFSWPGKINRYRTWQRIIEEHPSSSPFNFEQLFDSSEQKTRVSVLTLDAAKWASFPIPCEQVVYLTAPMVKAKEWLPRHKAPFTLLAYRWLGEIELCAYRMGLLQHAERGAEVGVVWSRVVQAMPVLAAAPLYSMEESLTRLFEAHHAVCHTVPLRRGWSATA